MSHLNPMAVEKISHPSQNSIFFFFVQYEIIITFQKSAAALTNVRSRAKSRVMSLVQ